MSYKDQGFPSWNSGRNTLFSDDPREGRRWNSLERFLRLLSERLHFDRTGVDVNAVTGTKGTSGNLVKWNADGDAVDASKTAADVVTGPSSAADNSVPTFDGTTGKLLQDKAALFVDDSGNVAGANNVISVTIASGVIALPAHTLPGTWALYGDTESAASTDDLDNVTGGVDGDVLFLRQANSARDITVKHRSTGAGEFDNNTGADIVFADFRGLAHYVYHGFNAEWIGLSSRVA